MAVTLKDIAEATGYSKSTVAQVLGNTPSSRVGESVRDLILDHAAMLGYRPNRIAQSLSTGRTKTISLVITSNCFEISIKRNLEIERLLKEEGFRCIPRTSDDNPISNRQIADELISTAVEG